MTIPSCVLPVIDVLDGQAVHAVAGERRSYRPLISQWTRHAHDPLLLAEQLRLQLGLTEFYIADLNALQQQGNNSNVIHELLNHGFQLWLDAGVRTPAEAHHWLSVNIHRMILASESLPSLAWLTDVLQEQSSERIVFSIDLKRGQFCAVSGVFTNDDPLAAVDTVVALGAKQLILLDTAVVGTASGPVTIELCRQVRQRYPGCRIITGGGVRNMEDIQQLQQAGADRVVVSTWLHRPTIGCDPSTGAPGQSLR